MPRGRPKKVKYFEGITVSVTGYKWTPGTHYIKKTLSREQYSQFQLYIAETLRTEIIHAIEKQRYAKGTIYRWAPLSINYLRYKVRHKLSTNIWEATGQLKRNIQVFPRGNWLVVGFKKFDCYPNTGISFNRIARYVEYGGVRMPPRPLFRAVTEYIRRNIYRYYKKFEREVLGIK
jgi:hypothetical protein